MEPQVRYVQTSDGFNIAYYTLGSGPPFVWLMAPTTHLLAERRVPEMREALDGTSRLFTLIRLDPRGFGLSDRDVTDFSPGSMARDVEAVVHKLDLGPVVLLGVALGSYPAMAYAALHPEDVSHLILMSTVRQGSEGRRAVLDRLNELAQVDWDLAADTIIRSFYGQAGDMGSLLKESVRPSELKLIAEQFGTLDVSETLRAPPDARACHSRSQRPERQR